MHALTQYDTCPVYFGGSYEERWSEDYRLAIEYSGQEKRTARMEGGVWTLDGPAPDLPLAKDYIDAACAVRAALRKADILGLAPEMLYEVFSCRSRVAPFELLRALLDDLHFELEAAARLAVRCCPRIDFGVGIDDLCKLEPRTAHLVGVLKAELSEHPIAVHDSRSSLFRSPSGALQAGETVRLSCLCPGGGINRCSCFLYGDGFEREYEMADGCGGFSVDITLPETPAALWYRFRAAAPDGERWLCPDFSGFFGGLEKARSDGFRLTVYKRGFDTPHWFKGAVMYQIFPDRFAFSADGTAEAGIEYHRALGQSPELHKSPGEPVRWQAREGEADYEPDDFYGGTIRGIEEKLPYIKSLGVSVIYLNPIVEARSNHRYDASDYMRVDPILGTDGCFSRLCDSAAKLGIRVMLDGVFSHTGADSVYFNRFSRYPGEGACQGDGSPYYKWYTFTDFPGKYKCWWNFPDLPEVDEENDAWQNFIIDGSGSVVKLWLRRGASGWRIDVADELPDGVLSKIRLSAKEERPDAVILGEVWEDAVTKVSYGARRNYALGFSLDSVMNYPLRSAILDFMHGRVSAYGLRDFLDGQRLNYPPPMYGCLMNLMGSHDVERLRTNLCADTDVNSLPRAAQASFTVDADAEEKAAKLQKLCAAIQFSLPGVPSIYYGDEVGMTGCRDPFNRLPYRPGRLSPLEFYRRLGIIRSGHSVMSTGEAEFSACGPDVLVMRRYGTGETVTVINRSCEGRPVFLPRDGKDLISGETFPPSFTVGPYAAVILETASEK